LSSARDILLTIYQFFTRIVMASEATPSSMNITGLPQPLRSFAMTINATLSCLCDDAARGIVMASEATPSSINITGLPQPLRGFAMTINATLSWLCNDAARITTVMASEATPSSINTYWIAAAPAGLRNDD
jgi:hypothetical protein